MTEIRASIPAPSVRIGETEGISSATVQQLYFLMQLARRLDDRLWKLNRQGKVPFVLSCQGHEGISAGAGLALNPQTDWIAPYYRDLPMVLTFGMTARDVMLGFYAKGEDPSSGGRQMPAHYGSLRRHILTGSSPVTTQIAHAAGVAWAEKLQGKVGVALASLGDGSTNQGEFHEALNFAAVHKLPLLVLVQNNGFAISTPLDREMAITDIARRADMYGIPGLTIDGRDPIAVYEAVKVARAHAAAGYGPVLIEAKTDRLTPHSSDDDDSVYKSAELRVKEKASDVVTTFTAWLRTHGGMSAEEMSAVLHAVDDIVDDATIYAERAPWPDVHTLSTHVYADASSQF